MCKRFLCIFLMLAISGCSYFQIRRPIIEQGNIITEENVSMLHPGMTPGEVTAVMGNPVLLNNFTPDRMEYVYTYQERTNARIDKRVSCIFSNGRLVRIIRT